MNDRIEFDYSILEGRIKQYYDTQDKFANEIPMGRATLNLKLNNKSDFTSQNIKRISNLLNITDDEIGQIFFKAKV
mgnify:CR=1 FL=1